jgi:hypothetical protein
LSFDVLEPSPGFLIRSPNHLFGRQFRPPRIPERTREADADRDRDAFILHDDQAEERRLRRTNPEAWRLASNHKPIKMNGRILVDQCS